MGDSNSNTTGDSDDGTEDYGRDENVELETLTREADWKEKMFRDAGEATFGNR